MSVPAQNNMEGVGASVSWLMKTATAAAQCVLAHNRIAQDEKAVRSLALTMLGAAAELTAGGNTERLGFKDYMSAAVTVLENDCSEFCKGARI